MKLHFSQRRLSFTRKKDGAQLDEEVTEQIFYTFHFSSPLTLILSLLLALLFCFAHSHGAPRGEETLLPAARRHTLTLRVIAFNASLFH